MPPLINTCQRENIQKVLLPLSCGDSVPCVCGEVSAQFTKAQNNNIRGNKKNSRIDPAGPIMVQILYMCVSYL